MIAQQSLECGDPAPLWITPETEYNQETQRGIVATQKHI